jgi:hypothetical protein
MEDWGQLDTWKLRALELFESRASRNRRREAHENKVAQERYKHGRQCVLSSDRMVRTYTIRIFTDDVHGDETKSRLVPATDQQPEGQT